MVDITISHCIIIYNRAECGNFHSPHDRAKGELKNQIGRRLARFLLLIVHFQLNLLAIDAPIKQTGQGLLHGYLKREDIPYRINLVISSKVDNGVFIMDALQSVNCISTRSPWGCWENIYFI